MRNIKNEISKNTTSGHIRPTNKHARASRVIQDSECADDLTITNRAKDSLGEIIEEITHLNPRPGEGKIGSGTETVIPDLLAVQREGDWVVIVNDSWIPDLNLSNEYVTLLNQI